MENRRPFPFFATRWRLALAGGLLVLAACVQFAAPAPDRDPTAGAQTAAATQVPGPDSTGPPPGDQGQPSVIEQTAPAAITVPEEVPPVDRTRHSVPLEEIYFDTFQPVNRAVPLTNASPTLIERLRDAIHPIHNPVYETSGQAGWLSDGDIVLGYSAGDQAWAYPVKILNFHEIVNDVLAGEPVLISYCPLCYSGIVYSRRVGDRELVFGNTSALYESDMVMLDYQTGSYWWQVAGQAIVGELIGERLEVLPATMATWAQWRQVHPDTLVLSRDTGFNINYTRDPFLGLEDSLDQGRFAFPVSPEALDERLRPGDRVLTVVLGGQARAYLLDPEAPRLYKDEVSGRKLVVFTTPDGPSGSAFSAELDGVAHSFILERGQMRDEETGSLWDLTGQAVEGSLAGARLEAIPAKVSFWFAIVAAEPEITVLAE